MSAQTVEPIIRVHQIEPPADVLALSTLERVDYADTFRVELPEPSGRTARAWAQATLDAAPLHERGALLSGWTSLGLRLSAPGAENTVLGWPVRNQAPDMVLLHCDSRVGMPAELLFRRERDGLLFATLIHHRHLASRAVWAGVEPIHVKVVPRLLERAARAG